MRTFENIEKIFQDEIREKKKTASGSFHKTGKGVKHGFNSALRTPSFFMKTKEKNQLNGEVQVTMYETIIKHDEFLLKDKEMQKLMFTRWTEIFSVKQIQSEMKINSKRYYEYISEFGIPPKRRGGSIPRKERKGKALAIAAEPVTQSSLELVIDNDVKKKEPEVKPLLVTRGLHLEYNGDYTAEELSKIFTKLQLVTDGEENKFKVSISLSERA